MNVKLSIEQWHQMALDGTAIPVRIPLMGASMYPLVRYNRDLVTIMPIGESIQTGDIVLFKDTVRDLYVVHRVWKTEEGRILTWGDNCDAPDGWLPKEAILGKVVLIERGRREIRPDPHKGIYWAKFWHLAGKGYRFYRKYLEKLVAKIRKQMRG